MDAARNHFFCVFGVQRSGNVLLASLLNAQGPIETGDAWLQTFLRVTEAVDFKLQRQLTTHEKDYLLKVSQNALKYYSNLELALSQTDTDDFETTLDLIFILYKTYTTPTKKFIGTRIHNPTYYLQQLAECPNLRLVILIRDVRDVILSELYRGRLNIDQYIKDWRTVSRFAYKYQEHPNVLAIRFEDLVRNPEDSASQLSRFLDIGINFTPETFKRVKWPQSHSSFDESSQSLSADPVERWRSYSNHEVVQYAEAASQSELGLWNYETYCTVPKLSQKGIKLKNRYFLYHTGTLVRDSVRSKLRRYLFPPLLKSNPIKRDK